ncbi:hypothetical protein OPV22_034903 [Ensete ventricosum]|uniref:Uncharacterized protein n=1 Tax=Ensete ventricosum TaxID=4639 RepID=A0AAV8PSU4_ENSVE|nr:hypothetical protein OPV22_034903 [Ensete ventricosum]
MVIAYGEDEDGPAASSPPLPQPPPSRLSRSRLHDFTFPTRSWGSHRTLRCSNLPFGGDPDNAGSVSPAVDQNSRAGRRQPLSPPDKSFLLQKQSSRFRDSKEGEGGRREEAGAGRCFSSPAAAAAETAGTAKPWNLRTRRAACNAPSENGEYVYPVLASGTPSLFEAEKSCPAAETIKRKSGGSENGERQKFSVALSRNEIEQDIWAIKGRKPPLRPKKRLRIVQRQLDLLFPGLWLSEVTPETYRIDE